MRTITLFGACCLLLFSLFTLMPALPAPWMDLPTHFVLQYAIAAAVGLAWSFYPLCTDRWAKLVFTLSLGLNLAILAPFMPWSAGAAVTAKSKPLKILQANVLYLNHDTSRMKQLIAEESPDIIVMLETNTAFASMLASIKADYPYQNARPENRGADGIAIAARIPLAGLKVTTYTGQMMPGYRFDIRRDGKTVRFLALHTMNPLFGVAERDTDFSGARDDVLRTHPEYLVVLGDFNATPWCPVVRHLMQALPQLNNARTGRGLLPSWPVDLPWPARIPIDQTLVSDNIAVEDYRLGPDIGSDHFPVISALALKEAK